MKKQLLYILLGCSFYCMQAQQGNIIIPPGNPVYITHNHYHNDVSQSLKHDSKHDSKNGHQQNQHENNATISTTHFNEGQLRQLQGDYQQAAERMYSWIIGNKIAITAVGIIASYGYILHQIYRDNVIIFDSLAWSNWQDGKKLEQLFVMPQATLEADLLYLFQHRFIDIHNPTDFIYSLVQSAISLQHEIDVVSSQIVRYQWIVACKCSQLFFIKEGSLADLQEKHRKLLFIKHIFASWCATYKIEKNN
ncbi:MAG: hypothetical protein Q8Q60_01300 [Candidatus Chromulinivorax sp.]|nr:hypothetical protein [Candidatus Chromulinivorax sp.]